jgi:hypothetical protein
MGFIICAGLISNIKTQGSENTNTSMIFLKDVSLAKLKVVWMGGLFMSEKIELYIYIYFFFCWLRAKRIEQLKYFLDSKTREAHNTT